LAAGGGEILANWLREENLKDEGVLMLGELSALDSIYYILL